MKNIPWYKNRGNHWSFEGEIPGIGRITTEIYKYAKDDKLKGYNAYLEKVDDEYSEFGLNKSEIESVEKAKEIIHKYIEEYLISVSRNIEEYLLKE